jgi:uncharacterized UBP type Zn finger protein
MKKKLLPRQTLLDEIAEIPKNIEYIYFKRGTLTWRPEKEDVFFSKKTVLKPLKAKVILKVYRRILESYRIDHIYIFTKKNPYSLIFKKKGATRFRFYIEALK